MTDTMTKAPRFQPVKINIETALHAEVEELAHADRRPVASMLRILIEDAMAARRAAAEHASEAA